MGGSLRRSKKYRPKLTIRKKRTPLIKCKVPLDITQNKTGVEEKLGITTVWSQQKRFSECYADSGLMSDPNSGYGRNSKKDGLQAVTLSSEERESKGEAAIDFDEDFEAACGKKRASGASLPAPLTSHQRSIVKRLLEAHGDDIEAMRRDSKLNSMLLPPAKLKRMIQSYRHYGDRRGVHFRVPIKRLW